MHVADLERTDADAGQADDHEVGQRTHFSDLSVAAFGQGEGQFVRMVATDFQHLDLDRLADCDAAVERVFKNPQWNDSNLKLGATVGIMAFGIAQTIRGRMRGFPEFNNCSSQFTYGEDEYRARMFAAPMWEQLGLRVGFNRTAESNYKTPAVNQQKDQLWLNWLCSQYVFTSALYGGLSETDAETMSNRWVSVQWDWLHTDPHIANMDFKRYWKKRDV